MASAAAAESPPDGSADAEDQGAPRSCCENKKEGLLLGRNFRFPPIVKLGDCVRMSIKKQA